MTPKIHQIRLLIAAAVVVATARTGAQGTAFTYQGELKNNGGPANGSYDLQFTLFDAAGSGNVVAGPLTNSATAVSNGLFTVILDFGSGPFTGNLRWLEIAVRTNGAGTFDTLSPRQELTPTPYAIFANTASNLSGTVASGQLSGTYGNPVDFSNGANVFDGSFYGQFSGSAFIGGTFVGSGSGLSDVWHTDGNVGTSPALNYLGTMDNQSLVIRVNGQQAERFDPVANDSPNIIGGSWVNVVDTGASGAVIAGGGTTNFLGQYSPNRVSASFSGIGGGSGNWIQPGADHTIIGSGWNNIAGSNAWESVLGGGQANAMNGQWAVLGGGEYNILTTNGYESFLGGGFDNIMNGAWSVIAGGYYNTNNAGLGFIGCGDNNISTTNAWYSFIGGGYANIMNGYQGTIGGGNANIINASGATIGGGNANVINASGATIGGGGSNTVLTNGTSYGYSEGFIGGGYGNTVSSYGATIGGGYGNTIQTNVPYPTSSYGFIGGGFANFMIGPWAVIGGGFYNTNNGVSTFVGSGDYNICTTNANYSFIGGGYYNQVLADSAFIGGGGYNTLGPNSSSGVIAGGYANSIGTNTYSATISGGNENVIKNNSTGATIGGGITNTIGANSQVSTIAGGNYNYIANNTWQAAIGGGLYNTNGGYGATVPGGVYNVASGGYGFAAGYRAKATNDGSFVWADSQNADFSSTTTNEFSVRANGGVRFVTSGAGMTLDGQPVLAGVVPGTELSGTYPNAVTFNNPGNNFSGNFSGNGGGLTNVNAATLGGLSSSSFWKTTGNAGTTPGANFIGTTDGQPLLVRANFVGIGRTNPITGSDSFSVECPVSGYYGGMYLNTTGTNGWPFYGYSQAGSARAWTYVDGSDTNKWKLNVAGGDRITVTTGGNVGIGTTTPDALLTVNGSADKPGGGSWAVMSDIRLKKNIHPLMGALNRLLELQGVRYEYKDPKAIHELPGVQIGMIAQQVEKVFPDWVETAQDGMKRLSIHGFEALTVEALRELRAEKDAKIAELEKANAQFQKQLAEQKANACRLEARLAALEKAFAGADGRLATIRVSGSSSEP